MQHEKDLREHVIALLKGGQAYEPFEQVVKEFKSRERGVIPEGAEHSAWQILEHMRFTLEDILEFSKSASYKEKNWPDDCWPSKTNGDWDKTIDGFQKARNKLISLVKSEKSDLFKPFPWGDGQTLLRESLLAADHQSYHIGELIMLKWWLGRRRRDKG